MALPHCVVGQSAGWDCGIFQAILTCFIDETFNQRFKPFSNSDILQTSNYGTIKLCGLQRTLITVN